MSWDTAIPTTLVSGTDYRGATQAVEVQDGHLEVRISDPDGWSGVSVVQPTPVIQETFSLGVPPRVTSSVAGTGAVTTTDSLMSCATGATVNSYASVATALGHYRAGQEMIYEFTARFTAGIASSVQIAGPHTGGDGAGFGYDGTSFGLLTRKGGKRAVAILTLSAASSAAATGTLRLNGTNFTTPSLSNASAVTALTAAEIAAGTYAGWTQQAVGSTVMFVQSEVGTASAGSYTFTHATAAGTFPANTLTTEGAAVTDTWVPQASWNQETMLGTGATPTVLDPTKLNAYRIRMRFLGAVGFFFDVYDPYPRQWTIVHAPTNANVVTTPFVINASLPMRWTAGSVGSTTNIAVYGASCKVAIGGIVDGTQTARSATGYNAAVGATLIPLCSVAVARAVSNLPSFAGALLKSVGAGVSHTRAVGVYLIKNATLTGTRYTALASDSVMLLDTAATAVSGGSQLFILPLGPDSSLLNDVSPYGFRLDPGETWTLAAVADSGTGADVRGTFTFQELR